MSKSILNIYYRETLDKIDSYEAYLSSMSITLDTRLWKKSLSANNKSAYQEYLNEYPKGNYHDEAQLKINEFNAVNEREKDTEAWNKALNQNTKSSYKKYLMNYYNGLYNNEAKRKVDEFIRLEKEKELEEKRLRDIEIAKEKEVWELVCKKDTKEDYENYLKFYPDGIYIKEANNLYNLVKNEIKHPKLLKRLFIKRLSPDCIGIEDRNGKEIVPYIYIDIRYIKKHALIKKDNRFSVWSEYSTPLNILDFNLMEVEYSTEKFNLINTKGEKQLKEEYENQFYFDKDWFNKNIEREVDNSDKLLFTIIRCFDIFTYNYSLFKSLFKKDVIRIQTHGGWHYQGYRDNTFGFIDKQGNILLEPIYKDIELLKNGLGIIRTKDDKYGLINNKYEIILEPTYHLIKYPYKSHNAFIVTTLYNDGTSCEGLVDFNGKIVCDDIYDYISPTKSKNIFLVKNTNTESYHLINHKGEIIGHEYCEEIKEVDENLFKLKSHNKYGIINDEGNYIFELEYDIIEIYKNFIKVHKHFSVGLADYNGNYILNREWVSINILDEFIIFTKDKQSGVMNYNKKILLEHGKYWESSIQIKKHPKDGRELVEYGTIFQTGLIDSKGEEIIPLMNNFKYNIVQTKFFKELWT
jgi:hypothetical protein